MNIKLKYLVEDVDRHGNVRRYVRVRGKPKVRVRGIPGTAEFMSTYQAALSETNSEDKSRKYQRAAIGSFGYACLAYYASAEFKILDPKTQQWRRSALDKICQQHGHKPIALMQPKHIRMLRDEKAATPAAANQRLRALKALFKWAVEVDMAPNDSARDVKAIQVLGEGFHSWTPAEIKQYEQTHPIGTKARLAMALILLTAARRGCNPLRASTHQGWSVALYTSQERAPQAQPYGYPGSPRTRPHHSRNGAIKAPDVPRERQWQTFYDPALYSRVP